MRMSLSSTPEKIQHLARNWAFTTMIQKNSANATTMPKLMYQHLKSCCCRIRKDLLGIHSKSCDAFYKVYRPYRPVLCTFFQYICFMAFFTHFGRYLLMLKGMFTKPENHKMYWKEFMHQCADIGIGSLGIVSIISVFIGAVCTVQTAYQLVSPSFP